MASQHGVFGGRERLRKLIRYLRVSGEFPVIVKNSSLDGRRASKDATSTEGYSWHLEKQMLRCLRRCYAPLLVKPAVGVAVGLLGLGGLVVGCALIQNKSIGYSPAELFPQSDPNYRSVGAAWNDPLGQ